MPSLDCYSSAGVRPMPTSGADKWPLNLVQLVVGYFDTGTLSETSEGILYFVETFNYYDW
ncbi:hypothetical protein [Lactiplantibacillus plantarum]|uniref:hypothetical protein n=1 Tax=Lactiplantibacillus plantarum TaxID=1590 RepID=UPI000B0265EE|nr:hypothetical protein [Lactiplantibacillus plantarum]MBA3078350.1 hypothetical protein [Lactiplantibacillus plantarum]MBA3081185.1 hypothetical protein [Lactiplantibacillus plantarum]MBA3084145.1 hypothetical protein [Lactiplantibacillus plantarum]MCG0773323.1 hypothetical protein [Lactiplantibacillus plantarum]MCG0874527.1 hypothetical protein [Lactiplantibacillus plantarum]